MLTLLLCLFACGTSEPIAAAEEAGEAEAEEAVEADDAAPTAKVNLNTASEDELKSAIPDIGPKMLHEFEEYRPYVSIAQFRKEMGKYVDDEKIASYEKAVYVPIAVNDSDAATLQQIDGLDASEAESLIAGRPYADKDAFLVALEAHVDPAQLEVGRAYVE